MFCPQDVCDLVLSSQNALLNLWHPCLALRWYVIWCFHHKMCCWTFGTHVVPSASMWSSAFITKSTAEPFAPMLCPQEVCDLVLSSQNPLLNLWHPCLALRWYVIWCFHHKIHCWTFCTHVVPSASMWSGAFITKCTAEPFAPTFWPQVVCDLGLSSQNALLNLLHPCSAFSEYVIWCFCHKMHCWIFCTHVLPSASMWSDVFMTQCTAEPFAPLCCPQDVCDLVLSSENKLLNLSCNGSTLSMYVTWSLPHTIPCWPSHGGIWPSAGMQFHSIIVRLCWLICHFFPLTRLCVTFGILACHCSC